MTPPIDYIVASITEVKHKNQAAIEHLRRIYQNFDKSIIDPDVSCALVDAYISVIDYRSSLHELLDHLQVCHRFTSFNIFVNAINHD